MILNGNHPHHPTMKDVGQEGIFAFQSKNDVHTFSDGPEAAKG
jgi:hypothetical protein